MLPWHPLKKRMEGEDETSFWGLLPSYKPQRSSDLQPNMFIYQIFKGCAISRQSGGPLSPRQKVTWSSKL